MSCGTKFRSQLDGEYHHHTLIHRQNPIVDKLPRYLPNSQLHILLEHIQVDQVQCLVSMILELI